MNIRNLLLLVVVTAIFTGCSANFTNVINDWFFIDLPRLISFLMPVVFGIVYFVRVINSKWYFGLLISLITHVIFVGLLMIIIMENETHINLIDVLKIFYFIR